MNVHQVKFISWLAATGLTAGLGYYVYAYTTGMNDRDEPWDKDLAQKILGQEHEVEGLKVDIVDQAIVVDVFHDLDWTGKPAPVVAKGPDVPVAPEVTETPVAELVEIFLIQQDSDRPTESTVFLGYTPASRVEAAKLPKFMKPGERLADPHQYIRIEDIDAVKGVTFAFDDEQRAQETVDAPVFVTRIGIISSLDADSLLQQRGPGVPLYTGGPLEHPKLTKMVAKDHFQLGIEDMGMFGEDYAEIIAQEVQHRRHKDPKTGRYDGIELTDVKSGGTVARHGGMSGDVIKSINGEPVTSVSEAITYVKNNKDKYSTWIVVVENMGRQRTLKYDSPPQVQQ